ncbi:MAG: Na+/H+ antiporter NhaA [Hyphomicrobiaceae bacterium]
MPQRITAFFQHEAASGILLVVAAILALIADNSPLSPFYDALLETRASVRIGAIGVDKPLLLWINDGLMAVFFFLVGLEIKREMIEGELSSLQRASLPIIAAIGGMAVPALVYVLINLGNPKALAGWAIPAATDIAFAVGVLALIGSRVPASLKLFLLALAIVDDLGAIIIIALFYTSDLAALPLWLALLGCATLTAMNYLGVRRLSAYVAVGVAMWVCVLKSGVHATLAGVALALAVPISASADGTASPAEDAEHALEPWVHFGILPLFAFANAGVSLAGLKLADLFAPIPLGIAAGLFVGKQVGIFGFTWLAVRMGLASMPTGATWRHVYGVALLGGIGFTMSLFIGTLAFPDGGQAAHVRLGVLVGSILSALAGAAVLMTAPAAPKEGGGAP